MLVFFEGSAYYLFCNFASITPRKHPTILQIKSELLSIRDKQALLLLLLLRKIKAD